MRTLPPRSSAFSFALVLFAILVVFPFASRVSAAAQSSSAVSCNPCSVSFGSVFVGGSESLPVTLTNNSSAPVQISNQGKTGAWAFSIKGVSLPLTLNAGQSVLFNVVFAPRTLRPVTGTLILATSKTSTVTISAAGTGVSGGGLKASPASLVFGSVPVGSSAVQSATITNASRASIALNQISLSASSSANPFTISGLNAPLTLTSGQSVTFSVTYRPTTSGNASGLIAVVGSNGSQLSIAEFGAATGTSSAQLSLSPGSLNFGNVMVGSTATRNLSLTASGSSVTVASGSLTSSEYMVSGISLPLTLAPGQSIPVSVTFQPQSSGSASANLTFASGSSSASGSLSAGASLSGTGMAAPQHSVALNWQASNSPVVGYNVYRGGKSGGPYSKLSGSADAATAYTDSAVQGGSTYYYVVTSVDGSGNESVFSNQVQASIPTP